MSVKQARIRVVHEALLGKPPMWVGEIVDLLRGSYPDTFEELFEGTFSPYEVVQNSCRYGFQDGRLTRTRDKGTYWYSAVPDGRVIRPTTPN